MDNLIASTYKKKNVRHILWPLREVGLNIRLENMDIYEEIVVRLLLDNKETRLFMN